MGATAAIRGMFLFCFCMFHGFVGTLVRCGHRQAPRGECWSREQARFPGPSNNVNDDGASGEAP